MKIPDNTLSSIAPTVAVALAEDIGCGDLTTGLVDKDAIVGATIISRGSLVLAGQAWADEVFRQLDQSVVVDWYIGDAQTAEPDDVICKLVGPARALLSGERTALNFLQTMSSTATLTAEYVAAIDGTGAAILDTRKTIPGLRLAQKYAVTCGGGRSHRIGLFDAVLIRPSHIRSAGSIAAALAAAAELGDDILIQIEVEDHDQLIQALDAGAPSILLDTCSIAALEKAVEANRGYGYVAAELEASGNVALSSVREIADTGVDFISTAAITENVDAVDLSMQFKID